MNKSFWKQQPLPEFPRAAGDHDVDVAVIGGGMTGLSIAYLLKRAGKLVCLLERDNIASGDTSLTTAHLTCQLDSRLSQLEKSYGAENTRRIWDAGEVAINVIESITRSARIDCGLKRVPGFLHASILNLKDDQTERAGLEADLATAHRLNLDVEWVEKTPVFEKPGIRFANQAKFHPLTYLAGLAKAIQGDGCFVYENSEVKDVQSKPLVVSGDGFVFTCRNVVVASHVPLMGKTNILSAAMFQTKIAPYSTYVVGAKIPRGQFHEMLSWDTTDPYYYLRVDHGREFDYAILGGCDHKTGQEDDGDRRYRELQTILREVIPGAEVDHRWSGRVVESHDGLPFIGEISPGQFIATGFSGNGMTLGTLAGLMACDAVFERGNRWQSLFSPRRKELHAGGPWNYVKENFDYPRYLFSDFLPDGDETLLPEVERGDGKVLRLDGKRVAFSRDEAGNEFRVSAMCTHMGCTVRWNHSEKTWDCPCHGSRFKPNGEVIGGPAEQPLKAL